MKKNVPDWTYDNKNPLFALASSDLNSIWKLFPELVYVCVGSHKSCVQSFIVVDPDLDKMLTS